MASSSDRATGLLLLLIAIFVFVYYTFWVLVTPFIDSDHFVHSLFPDRVWAVRLPALVLVLGVSVIGTFIGSVMINAKKPKLKKVI